MNASATSPGGWLESLRRIGGSLAALTRCRFELFTVEWQEEKLRLLRLLLWLGLAAALGLAGIFIGFFALALWLWATAGYAGLIGLAVGAMAVAMAMFFGIRRRIQASPPPFAQTVAELRKDGECLRGNA